MEVVNDTRYSIRNLIKQPAYAWAFSAVACVLLVAALLACLLPAWRASKVEPMVALRYQ